MLHCHRASVKKPARPADDSEQDEEDVASGYVDIHASENEEDELEDDKQGSKDAVLQYSFKG